jgi:hypothetical protein
LPKMFINYHPVTEPLSRLPPTTTCWAIFIAAQVSGRRNS